MSIGCSVEDPPDSIRVDVRGTLSPLAVPSSDVIILWKENFCPKIPKAAKGKVISVQVLPPLSHPRTFLGPCCWKSGVQEEGEGPRRQVNPQLWVLGSHLGCREFRHLVSVSGISLASRCCILPSSGRMKRALSLLVYMSSTSVQPSSSSRK